MRKILNSTNFSDKGTKEHNKGILMGFFDDTVQNEIKKKDEKNIILTKEDILKDIEEYRDLLPEDIYNAVKEDPELMAEVIMLLLKKKDDEDGKDARALYRERQVSRGRSI